MAAITESDVERAIDYLRDTAESTAQARANRIYLEEYRKSLKATLMREHMSNAKSSTGTAQERDAYADERYIKHLEGLRDAVFVEQKALFLREAANAKLEAWRTMSANYRGMSK
jgi:hypothetical protein